VNVTGIVFHFTVAPSSIHEVMVTRISNTGHLPRLQRERADGFPSPDRGDRVHVWVDRDRDVGESIRRLFDFGIPNLHRPLQQGEASSKDRPSSAYREHFATSH
jgi:hypothetical protein